MLEVLEGEKCLLERKMTFLYIVFICYYLLIVLAALSSSTLGFSRDSQFNSSICVTPVVLVFLVWKALLPVLTRKAVLFLQIAWEEFSHHQALLSQVKWESFAKRLLYVVEKDSAAGVCALQGQCLQLIMPQIRGSGLVKGFVLVFLGAMKRKFEKSQMPCRIPMTFWQLFRHIHLQSSNMRVVTELALFKIKQT